MIFTFCNLYVSVPKFTITVLSDPLHPRGLRCPLILHCGHTVCENCIRTSLRSTDKVVCGICKHSSTATCQDTDIRLDFPLNIYLLGIFAARHWGSEPEDSAVTFASSSASCNRKATTVKGIHQNNKRGKMSNSLLHTKVRKEDSLDCPTRYSLMLGDHMYVYMYVDPTFIAYSEKNLHTNRA
jgi:hypothetical protein